MADPFRTPVQNPVRILVTGERDDLPKEADSGVLWISLAVLKFERIEIPETLVKEAVETPFDWIIFTSPRSVSFWNEVLLDYGSDFPIETQVACIGESTASKAANDGYTPDFFPTEPGTEKFLFEFASLITNRPEKPSVLIPMAEGGRAAISERLKELGCRVVVVPLYRTKKRDDIADKISKDEIAGLSAIVFTSPSSVDAFSSTFEIPNHVKVVSIGTFTSSFLTEKGIIHRVLPGGDFSKLLGEVL